MKKLSAVVFFFLLLIQCSKPVVIKYKDLNNNQTSQSTQTQQFNPLLFQFLDYNIDKSYLYYAGNNLVIKWLTSTSINNIKIELVGMTQNRIIISDNIQNNGEFHWIIPDDMEIDLNNHNWYDGWVIKILSIDTQEYSLSTSKIIIFPEINFEKDEDFIYWDKLKKSEIKWKYKGNINFNLVLYHLDSQQQFLIEDNLELKNKKVEFIVPNNIPSGKYQLQFISSNQNILLKSLTRINIFD